MKFDSAKLKEVEDHCLIDGVVDLDKLLETKDFQVIEEVVNKHPITVWEYLLDLAKKGDFKTIFEIAVDRKLPYVSGWFLNPGTPFERALKKQYDSLWNAIRSMSGSAVGSYVPDVAKLVKQKIANLSDKNADTTERLLSAGAHKKHTDSKNSPHTPLFSEIKEKVFDGRQLRIELLDPLYKELSFEPVAQKFNEEYFQSFLESEQFEFLALNLCSRLDSYLTKVEQLQGSLKEKWHIFRKDKGFKALGPESCRLIDKLISYRNKVAHPELDVDASSLSPEEFQTLIRAICDLR